MNLFTQDELKQIFDLFETGNSLGMDFPTNSGNIPNIIQRGIYPGLIDQGSLMNLTSPLPGSALHELIVQRGGIFASATYELARELPHNFPKSISSKFGILDVIATSIQSEKIGQSFLEKLRTNSTVDSAYGEVMAQYNNPYSQSANRRLVHSENSGYGNSDYGESYSGTKVRNFAPAGQMRNLPSYDRMYNSNFDNAPSGGTYSNGGTAYYNGSDIGGSYGSGALVSRYKKPSPTGRIFSLPSYDVLYNSNFDTAPSGGTYSNGWSAYGNGDRGSKARNISTYSNSSPGYSETSGGRDAMDSYSGSNYGNGNSSGSSTTYNNTSNSKNYGTYNPSAGSVSSRGGQGSLASSPEAAPSTRGNNYNYGSSRYTGSDYGDGNTSGSSDSGTSKPILMDLDGDGLDITSLESSNFYYDMDGDGQKNLTAWAGAGDGVLVRDAGDDGVIDLKEEIDFTSWAPSAKSDLEALRAAFDTNNDDKLNASDADWALFKVLVTNADGTTTLKTLAQLGITEIDLISNNQEIILEDGSKSLAPPLTPKATAAPA
ncbi:MAG: hypothetical protein ABJO09_14155 [Hyphomicrobiales bacterium]